MSQCIQKLTEQILNIADIVPCTESEGMGKRFAIWGQGCPFRCPECCNPHMQEDFPNRLIPVSQLFQSISHTPDIEGVTFIGGEPFLQAKSFAELAKQVRSIGLSVIVFTGYTLEYIKQKNKRDWNALVETTDVLIDGLYDQSLPDHHRRWIGSTNQKVHFLSDHYSPWWEANEISSIHKNTIELRIKGDQMSINGFPHASVSALIKGEIQ